MSKNFELLKQLEGEWRIAAADERAESDVTKLSGLRPQIGVRTYDELSKLVQRLFRPGADASRCVLFTGAAPGVGCTWVIVHTAKVLCSQTAARVCLVGIDANPDGFREHFKIPNGEDSRDGIVQHPLPTYPRRVEGNLWVLPADENQAGDVMLSRQVAEARLLELRREFDYVLLDAPAVASSSLIHTFGPLVEGAVLVLKAGFTRRPAVRLAIEELEHTGVKVLGTVLNQREYPIPDSIYRRL